MANFRPADHAMGLELQIEELIEQRERARVQGRVEDARHLAVEIGALQAELASTAEQAAVLGNQDEPEPELHDADKLSIEEPPD
jgi:hypothetical protein